MINLRSTLTSPTARYSLIQGSYWACYAVINTYAAVYLLFRGFSNSQIGILIAISGLLSALLQPFVSRIADGLRRMPLRLFAALVILLELAAGVLLFLLPQMVSQAALYALLLILIQLVLPLCSALGMACLNHGLPMNFGAARAGGSISYGVFCAVCGQLVLWFGELSLPAAMTLLNGIFLLSVGTFRFRVVEDAPTPQAVSDDPSGNPPGSHRPFCFQYRRVLPFLLGVIFLFTSHNVLNTFAIQIVTPLGGDSGQMGTMLFIQAIVELPVMFAFTWMVSKKSSRFWLRLSGIGFFLHAFGALLAPSMGVMYVIQIFEMNGYALFTLASIYFINETVRETQRVQGQAWLSLAMTMGNVLPSFVGGLLLDYTSVFTLLLFATLAGAAGMALLWGLLGKNSVTMTPTSPVQ